MDMDIQTLIPSYTYKYVLTNMLLYCIKRDDEDFVILSKHFIKNIPNSQQSKMPAAFQLPQIN